MPDQPYGSPLANKLYPQPMDMKVEKTPEGVVINRRWFFKSDDFFIGVIGIIVLIFELGNLVYGSSGVGLIEIIFLIFGPCMLYFSLAHRFNSTRFTVRDGNITIRKGPLPWFGGRMVLSIPEIEKLSLRGERRQTRKSGWTTFRVIASLRSGKDIVLDTCEKGEQAGFLHQELKKSLDL